MYDNIASAYLNLLEEQREDSIHPMINVDGIQRHRHNSEGKPIHHTDEGIRNFHRWFGDSDVVDQHGRPQVMYHATGADFDEFKVGSRGLIYTSNTASGAVRGAIASQNEFITGGSGASNVMPVYVKSKIHGLSLNKPDTALHETLPNEMSENEYNSYMMNSSDGMKKRVMGMSYDEKLNPDNTYTIVKKTPNRTFHTAITTGRDLYGGIPNWGSWSDEKWSANNLATNKLHDGMLVRDESGISLAVLHPHQIKSALGNSGAFNHPTKITESIEHPMIDVDGEMKHRHNSEGKPIHPSDEGIKNFHRWFKNGITDEHGRPQVFYHGTKHQEPIKNFKIGGLSSSELTGDAYGVGTYLTTSKGEASAYTIGKENVGGVYPLYAKGNILDIDAKELPREHQKKLTDYANENLLPSDKSRFQSDARKTAIFNQDELEDAKDFFDNHMKNYEHFGDGYDRNKPEVEQHGDKFHISYIDYNAPIHIKTGNDAHNLLRSVGFDNLKHAGFDGLSMNRQGGAKWLIMQSPDYNLKSAIGNKGTFNNISSQLSESVNHPMIDVDGEMKHRTNSSGKLIHYTDEGIKNFHRWFDNSSNVDEHGRPLVMYHGTGRDLTQFNRMSWVSHEPHLANEYADYRGAWSAGNPNVVPVYAKSNKPFDADALPSGSVTIGQFFSELLKQSHPERSVELKAHMDSLKAGARQEESGPYYSAKDFWHEPNVHFGSTGEHTIHNALKTAGFDSISYTEDGHKTLGLLRPNQLKSAIGNNGNFSGEKHEIVESKQDLDIIDSVLQQYDNR